MTTREGSYERPRLLRQPVATVDKQWAGHAAAYPVTVGEGVEGFALEALRAQYGTPLYVVSESALRRNLRAFLAAFRARYPRTVVAYSYKTNYLTAICAALHQDGAWAEVVSGFELDHALRLGVTGRHIVYNGPYKAHADLARAAGLGVRINVDHLEELADLEEIARKLGRRVKAGLRVNMRLNDPPWDKFGFNLESGQALDACRRIAASGSLTLAGLHLHAGTWLGDPGVYARAVAGLTSLAKVVAARRLGDIEYLDLGGGYASTNTALDQLLPGDVTAPGFTEYADAIGRALKAGLRGLSRRPLLILEPGRAIVDEPVSLLASVVAVKTTASGRRLVVVDAGVNLLPTAYYFRHDVAVGREPDASGETADIVGPLCMQIDVLRRDVALPPVSRGSLLLFRHAGAYTISNSMQFIFPRPPVVLVRGDESWVVRRAETPRDLTRLDCVPSHLGPRRARSPRGGHRTR